MIKSKDSIWNVNHTTQNIILRMKHVWMFSRANIRDKVKKGESKHKGTQALWLAASSHKKLTYPTWNEGNTSRIGKQSKDSQQGPLTESRRCCKGLDSNPEGKLWWKIVSGTWTISGAQQSLLIHMCFIDPIHSYIFLYPRVLSSLMNLTAPINKK